MMDEQGTCFAVLLEDVDRKLGVMAEAIAAQRTDSKTLQSNFEGLESRFSEMTFEMKELKKTVSDVATKVDRLDTFATEAGPRLKRLEGKVDRLEGKVDKLEGKVDNLDTFATEAGPRLVRIETHLALPAPASRRETTSPMPSKHHRRKPAKRT
jgi:predicted nuclease with TOPRIM domain